MAKATSTDMFHFLFIGFGLVMGIGLAIKALFNFHAFLRILGWGFFAVLMIILMIMAKIHQG